MDQESFDGLSRWASTETIVYTDPITRGYIEEINLSTHRRRITDAFIPTDVLKQLLRLRVGRRGDKGKLVRDIRPCINDDREHPTQYGWLGDIAVHALPPVYADASLVLVAAAWKDTD